MGGGQILSAPYNSVISKDIDLKFGMLTKSSYCLFKKCNKIYANYLNDVIMTLLGQISDLQGITSNLYF